MSRGNGKKKKKYAPGIPHLLRQRGKRKYWTGWAGGQEVSLRTADAVEATKRLLELAEQRKRAKALDPAAAKTALTLAALAAQYVEFIQPPRRSPRTAESIEGRVLKFVEWAEARGVSKCSDVERKVVERYANERSLSGACARTVNRDLTPVAQMFAFGARKELIAKNPLSAEDYKDLRLKEPTPAPNLHTLTTAQIDMLLRRAYEVLPLPYAALFDVIAGTGMRLDEACHIDANDIDYVNKVVKVTPKEGWTTKNYRFREVPASEQTIKALRHFVRTRGEVSLDRKQIWNQLQRVRKLVGLPHFSPHDLRRAWASAMHDRGASLKLISHWLGHGGLGVTERYIRLVRVDGHQYLPR